MGNIHDGDKYRPIRTLAHPNSRRLAVDFPGWGHPDYARYLLDIPEYLTGIVVNVESHNSNPWTRYSVRFVDGTSASGLVAGEDFEFTKIPPPEGAHSKQTSSHAAATKHGDS
ncbi:MAG: hypothetical protein J2P17_03620 [Mycobacterium sp.]|nr:hypothetical protein [Mycobacterium sp.]